MAALRKSIGEPVKVAEAAPKKAAKNGRKALKPEETRQQPGLKLPIAGGGKGKQADTPAEQPADTGRSRREAS